MTLNCLAQKYPVDFDFTASSAQERIKFVLGHYPGPHALTSSFGIDAVVSLHMLSKIKPDIPVILIDTGYLFPETYAYVEQLEQSLGLNLHIHQSNWSPARFENKYGQLWTQGVTGINHYNQLRKLEPLETAFQQHQIKTWFSGVRRSQSSVRQQLEWVTHKNGRHKAHPLLDWTDRQMFEYIQAHQLPQHPLWDQGYLTVGDTHSTRSIHEVDSAEQMRYFGLKRECGMHE